MDLEELYTQRKYLLASIDDIESQIDRFYDELNRLQNELDEVDRDILLADDE